MEMNIVTTEHMGRFSALVTSSGK